MGSNWWYRAWVLVGALAAVAAQSTEVRSYGKVEGCYASSGVSLQYYTFMPQQHSSNWYCHQLCREEGLPLAFTQKNKCGCGIVYPTTSPLSIASCSTPCQDSVDSCESENCCGQSTSRYSMGIVGQVDVPKQLLKRAVNSTLSRGYCEFWRYVELPQSSRRYEVTVRFHSDPADILPDADEIGFWFRIHGVAGSTDFTMLRKQGTEMKSQIDYTWVMTGKEVGLVTSFTLRWDSTDGTNLHSVYIDGVKMPSPANDDLDFPNPRDTHGKRKYTLWIQSNSAHPDSWDSPQAKVKISSQCKGPDGNDEVEFDLTGQNVGSTSSSGFTKSGSWYYKEFTVDTDLVPQTLTTSVTGSDGFRPNKICIDGGLCWDITAWADEGGSVTFTRKYAVEVTTKTSPLYDADFIGSHKMRLVGVLGKTEQFSVSAQDKGETSVMTPTVTYVGPITAVELDSDGNNDAWLVDTIEVQVAFSAGTPPVVYKADNVGTRFVDGNGLYKVLHLPVTNLRAEIVANTITNGRQVCSMSAFDDTPRAETYECQASTSEPTVVLDLLSMKETDNTKLPMNAKPLCELGNCMGRLTCDGGQTCNTNFEVSYTESSTWEVSAGVSIEVTKGVAAEIDTGLVTYGLSVEVTRGYEFSVTSSSTKERSVTTAVGSKVEPSANTRQTVQFFAAKVDVTIKWEATMLANGVVNFVVKQGQSTSIPMNSFAVSNLMTKREATLYAFGTWYYPDQQQIMAKLFDAVPSSDTDAVSRAVANAECRETDADTENSECSSQRKISRQSESDNTIEVSANPSSSGRVTALIVVAAVLGVVVVGLAMYILKTRRVVSPPPRSFSHIEQEAEPKA